MTRRGTGLAPVRVRTGNTILKAGVPLTKGAGGGRRQREQWEAETTDGAWAINRQESTTTPWLITHIPSGQICEPQFGTLKAARAYIDSGSAEADLRTAAGRVIARDGATPGGICSRKVAGLWVRVEEAPAERLARVASARRVLAILDGQLLTLGEPDAHCGGCEGLLTWRPVKGWAHLDLCDNCRSGQRCPDVSGHAWCGKPDPDMCRHAGCARDENLGAHTCGRGLERCCGCCHL